MIKLRLKSDPRRESLLRRIEINETYLESMVAGTEEYDIVQHVLLRDYEELRKIDENKVKAKDILPWISLAVTAVAGIVVPVYGMKMAYRSEEVDGKLKNGTVFNLATKNMKSTK